MPAPHLRLLLIGLLVTAACDSEDERTYYEDVRPILQGKCSMCHTDKVGSVLGVSPEQLDRPYDYGYGPENQLESWRTVGMFAHQTSTDSC